jgi:hypothetical protein
VATFRRFGPIGVHDCSGIGAAGAVGFNGAGWFAEFGSIDVDGEQDAPAVGVLFDSFSSNSSKLPPPDATELNFNY